MASSHSTSANGKIVVNSSTTANNLTTEDAINRALISNGGVERIQAALKQALDEQGWTETMSKYVTQLFRSGECTTYDDVVNKVTEMVKAAGVSDRNARGNATNGHANGVGGAAPNLMVPKSAVDYGVKAVRKELDVISEPDKR